MTDETTNKQNTDLMQEGIKQLDSAMSHFSNIKGCDHGDSITRVTHGLIDMAQLIFSIYKARK